MNSASHSSGSSPFKSGNADRSSDYEENIDEILGVTEQESEIGITDADNVDDSKEYDVGEDIVDEGDEERDVEENEEAALDDIRSPNKSQSAGDAFDTFQFVREDDVPSSESLIEDETVPDASDWLEGDRLYTSHINNARHFVCVDYPGVIQNQDRALATLGGLEGLSKVLSEDLKLELAFRPDDPYCKPTVGSFTHTKNLLLKIRRRLKTTEDIAGCCSSSEGDGFEYQIQVVGVVDKVYIFDRLCDFQYLPVTKEADGKYKEILSSIRPNIKDDRKEYLSRNVPIFLPPFSFSRREIPVSYNFDTETVQPGEENDKMIGIDRKKRVHGTIHISYSHPDVPSEPDPVAFEHLRKLPNQDAALGALRKLFDEQPLWSKTRILAHLDKAYHGYLKYLLPIISFYFINGPWKNLWCRFGYDPRKNPEAKIYQTLDYRVRSMANRQKVEPKRQDIIRSSQYGLKPEWNSPLFHQIDASGRSQADIAASLDLSYTFTPSHIPPNRQMRYQVCDVHHEDIQRLMHQNDGQETCCTERDGWCVPDFTDVSRDIISATVEKLFAQ